MGNVPLETELFTAAKTGNAAKVREIVRANPERWRELEVKDENGCTSLHWAAIKGHVKIAEYLIEKGANVEAQDKDGKTPFLVTCAYGQVGVATLLLAEGCNRHAKNTSEDGALAYAISNRNPKMTKTLVEMGFDVDETYQNNYTSLHWAAEMGHVKIAEYLIDQAANVEAQDKDGRTPFLVTCKGGQMGVAKLLLAKGCNRHAKSSGKEGALAYAIWNGNTEMTKELVELGFDVDETHLNGYTSLHYAAQKGHVKIAEYLVEKGANVEAQDKKGHTASALACIHGHHDTARCLLSNFNDKTKDDSAVLHSSVQNDFDKVIALLISMGANVESKDQWGCTPFLTAVEFGCDNAINLLIKKGCNIHATTDNGECALDLAIFGGRFDLFKYCIDVGIDVNRISKKSQKFIRGMADEGNEEAMKYLGEIKESLAGVFLEAERDKTLFLLEEIERLKAQEEEQTNRFLAAEERHVQCLERERNKTMRREEEVARMQEASATLRTRARNAESENEQLKILHKSEVAELRAAAEEEKKVLTTAARLAVEEKETELAVATRTIDDLKTERAALLVEAEEREGVLTAATTERDRALADTERQQTLLRQMQRRVANLSRSGEEKDAKIKKLKEYDDLLKIPIEDVQLTGVQLGGGSYGAVGIGRWRGALVAVKIFHEALQGHYCTLFHREIEICARVRHPNIVSICGVTTVDDTPLRIISDLLEGSLCDVITAAPLYGGELTLREKADLGIGFVAGISYLHQLLPTLILHGNIRSTNVLVTTTMEAQVGDLGSARFANASLSAGPHSPEYIAPERIKSHENTAMADIYSLGVTLAELMTCKEPNREERHTQVGMIRHEEIRDLCLQMIDDTPAERPDAHACLEVLQVVCSTPEYTECPPKRLVRGKAHGHGRVVLANKLEEFS